LSSPTALMQSQRRRAVSGPNLGPKNVADVALI
jgi:hypothetical protein